MKKTDNLTYQSGFGNHFATESIVGALPHGQNSPQKAPLGLYAEQISGSAFSAPRNENQRNWFYRIRPSVLHGQFAQAERRLLRGRPFTEVAASPNQMRWDPLPVPSESTDFVQGLVTMAGNGDSASVRGSAVHLYSINQSMKGRYFYNADGELLIVPQQGALRFRTECGVLECKPGEIVVIPRGIKFLVEVLEKTAVGYVCENYGPAFRLPHLGVIGANGLANPRDFLYPTAAYEDVSGNFQLLCKFQGHLWEAAIEHSPLDVVAWHGNYAPYKYDLNLFQVLNTVSFDHCDPSIFTVLTSPSEIAGTANVDFVIFPPRWLVAEHTFRPPYYHRNVMSEYMGCIYGVYDAKEEGFVPGGSSLHNSMSAHGPDNDAFQKASKADLKPVYLKDTLSIMFESSLIYQPTVFATTTKLLQRDYMSCWKGLESHFQPAN